MLSSVKTTVIECLQRSSNISNYVRDMAESSAQKARAQKKTNKKKSASARRRVTSQNITRNVQSDISAEHSYGSLKSMKD